MMRGVLLTAAAVAVGSGLGLLLNDALSPGNPEVSGLPILVQPIAASLVGLFAYVAKTRTARWASVLALSLVSAMSAASLRIAATALGILRVPSAARPQLLSSLSFPQRILDQSMLTLLFLSLTLTLGQILLAEGFVRQLSPLWIGFESLPTTLSPTLQIDLKKSALGLPLGVLLAWLDLGTARPLLRVVPWAFTLLYTSILPAATAFTLLTHLALQHALISSGVLSSEVALGVRVGVQLGLVASTVAAVVLLHAGGGARLYPKRYASLIVSMLGLLLLLLGYVVIEVAYAVYLLLNTLLLMLLAVIVAVRLEGGAFALFHPVYPVVPELLQFAWLALTGISESAFAIRNAELLMNFVVNPSLVLVIAVMAIWDCKLEPDVGSAVLLPLSLSAPLFMTLARAGLALEDFSLPSRLAAWGFKAPTGVVPGPWVLAIVATITSVATFLSHYAVSFSSKWCYVKFVLDPSGLMLAYSAGHLLPGGATATAFLAGLAGVNAVRLLLVTTRVWIRIKNHLHGAIVSYGVTSIAQLLYLRFRSLG